MGYTNIFWVNEKPIRDFITQKEVMINEGTRNKVAVESEIVSELGNAILKLSVHDSFTERNLHTSQDALGAQEVFHSVGSFHSNAFAIFIWTGNKLIHFVDANQDDFRCLEKIDILSKSPKWITHLSTADKNSIVSRLKKKGVSDRNNPLHTCGIVSIWSIIEDFTRQCIRVPEEEWPSKQVGSAFLDLMLDNWNRSGDITFHGGYGAAVTRVGTFLLSEFGVFIWADNCLQRISDIDESDKDRMYEYLRDH